MSENMQYLVLQDAEIEAIIGHCMTNTSFMRNCARTLQPKHIYGVIPQELYAIILEFYKPNRQIPTRQEVISALCNKFPDEKSRGPYLLSLNRAIDLQAKNFQVNNLSRTISGWMKVVLMRDAVNEQVKHYNSDNYVKVADTIMSFVRKVKDAEFEEDARIPVTDMKSVISSLVTNRTRACTLGHPDFDELVMANSRIRPQEDGFNEKTMSGLTRGCLLPGEITILMGPSNTGKTTTLATIAVSNIAMQKRVAYVSCEDPKDKLRIKLLQSFSETDMIALSNTNNKEFEDRERSWNTVAGEYLYFYEWIKPGKMYVEDVILMIENENEKVMAAHGRGFDLLIVDYPGLLSSREFGRGKDVWAEKTHVYNEFRLLGKNLEFHVVAPIQTNREGFKQNSAALQILDLDSIAQGFAIGANADNVITINRNPSDHQHKRIKFYVAKNRSGENKQVFLSETRFDLGRTHGINYGAVIVNHMDLNKMTDETGEEWIMTNLRRAKTSGQLAAVNPSQVAYNVAPPADKAQEKAATTLAAAPATPSAPVAQPAGSFNVPVAASDLEKMKNDLNKKGF